MTFGAVDFGDAVAALLVGVGDEVEEEGDEAGGEEDDAEVVVAGALDGEFEEGHEVDEEGGEGAHDGDDGEDVADFGVALGVGMSAAGVGGEMGPVDGELLAGGVVVVGHGGRLCGVAVYLEA